MKSPPRLQRPPRKYFCTFLACGKSFTRAEHLQRHELNHRDSPNTCKRCSAHFARPDLLERHMERHAQKDKEAGGEGLGVLITRKRCWRDENGNITTKRPASSVAAAGKALEARLHKQSESSDEGGFSSGGDNRRGTISPRSSSGSTQARKGAGHGFGMIEGFGQFQGQEQLSEQPQNFSGIRFLSMTDLPPRGHQLGQPIQNPAASGAGENFASGQTEIYEHFSADTNPGFNTSSSTSQNGFHWLFEEFGAPGNGQRHLSSSFCQDLALGIDELDTRWAMGSAYGSDSGVLSSPEGESGFLGFVDPLPEQYFQRKMCNTDQQLEHRLVSTDQDSFRAGSTTTILPASGGFHSSSPNPRTLQIRTAFQSSKRVYPEHTRITTLPSQYFDHSLNSLKPNCGPAIIPPSTTSTQHQPPRIGGAARERVLELINQLSSASGGPPFRWDDPLFSLPALQNYSDLFFSRFNPTYSLVNQQSFDPNSVNTLSLVRILMLGATYAGTDARQMTARVRDVLQGVLVSACSKS